MNTGEEDTEFLDATTEEETDEQPVQNSRTMLPNQPGETFQMDNETLQRLAVAMVQNMNQSQLAAAMVNAIPDGYVNQAMANAMPVNQLAVAMTTALRLNPAPAALPDAPTFS